MIVLDRKVEDERVARLRSYDLMDKSGTIPMQGLVELAASRFQCLGAAITLIDDKEQVFKASSGIPIMKLPKSQTVCQHTIMGNQPLVVPDLQQDVRFAHLKIVAAGPKLRFYAGWPLSLNGRHRVGAFCLLDNKPRSFGVKDRSDLSRFALLAEKLFRDEVGKTRRSLT